MTRSSGDQGLASTGRLAAALGCEGECGAPGLACRLDEAAALIHPLGRSRTVLILFGAAMAEMIIGWPASLAWAAGGLAIEIWSWLATRAPARGTRIGWPARGNFVASFLVMNLWWLLLSGLMWRMGTVEGHATGAVILAALACVFVLLFHNVPAAFLAAGAAPAVAALTVVVLQDGLDWRRMLPIWLSLGLGMIFCIGRAVETPSAQESKRRLNQSLNDFEILAENVTDIIARTDLDGVHQYVSPACLSVLGYRQDEMIGVARRTMLHPDSREAAVAAYRRMFKEPSRSEVVTVRVRHKDGHWVWLQSSAKLVCQDGVPVGMIDVSRDVTERVATWAALQAAKAEAESANRAKADFLANVSHEIRTPMNGVLGALHLLESETISSEGRELMRQANGCGRMLSQLLNDLLDFSKIEAGQLELSPEPTDLGEVLRSVTALLDGQARGKGLDLRCEIVGRDHEGARCGDLWIEADSIRLRQALFNLVGNAVKFTVRGHVAVRLAVEPAPDGRRHVRVEVEDTGIGLTAEAQSHLFERFRQGEGNTTRRFGGAGLGLSITRALVRMMGGDIGFTSAEGQGSTFWLAFEAPAAEMTAAAAGADGMLEGVNILLVEDNPMNRLVARTILTRLGATVEEAEDGVLGLEAARGGAHDLILMDIQMPRMDGVETTRAIRGLSGPAGQTPIIGLTANAMVHQRTEYLAAGMNGVVAKPISPANLLAEISRLIGEEPQPAGRLLEAG
ncbi:MAG TPA: ATP-binding protein [Caulobacteraceae bacterium]